MRGILLLLVAALVGWGAGFLTHRAASRRELAELTRKMDTLEARLLGNDVEILRLKYNAAAMRAARAEH